MSSQLAHVGAVRAVLMLSIVAVATFAALMAAFGDSGTASPVPQPKAVSSLERPRSPEPSVPAHAPTPKAASTAGDDVDPYARIARRERRRARRALAAARRRARDAGPPPRRRRPAVQVPAIVPQPSTTQPSITSKPSASSTGPAATSPAAPSPPSGTKTTQPTKTPAPGSNAAAGNGGAPGPG